MNEIIFYILGYITVTSLIAVGFFEWWFWKTKKDNPENFHYIVNKHKLAWGIYIALAFFTVPATLVILIWKWKEWL